MAGGEVTCEVPVQFRTGRIETEDLDMLATGYVAGGDCVECGDGRSVPDVGVRQVDDHPIGVVVVIEVVSEVVGGGKEQVAHDPVHPIVAVGAEHALEGGEVRDPAGDLEPGARSSRHGVA